MLILGISCYYHDSAAALLKDGEILAAAQEERFSRKKNDNAFPHQAIDFCLQAAGINATDLDYVVFYEKPLLKFERVLMTSLSTFPKSWKSFSESMISWFDEKLWIRQSITENLGIDKDQVSFVEHHLSHAASAFFASPFEEAAVVTIDGVGEWATTTIGQGSTNPETKENRLEINFQQEFPHSIGLLYSAFTAFLGFRVNSGEYKVMGMSPYGEANVVDKIEKIFKIHPDGSFQLDLDYFSYHYSTEQTFNNRFVDLFGEPRIHESDFFTSKTHPNMDIDPQVDKANQGYANIAASIQHVTEQAIFSLANAGFAQTGSKNLCIAGGVGLNSKANGKILQETAFEELFIQPAAGDAGGALGAALYHYHVELGHPRKFVQEHCYLGEAFNSAQISEALENENYEYEEHQDQDALVSPVIDDLLEGKVISLFQGRAEWGPRALGNRSILADPRREDMKEKVNLMIKFREPFRPFAPAIREEDASNFFPSLKYRERSYPPRFMLEVHPWEKDFGEKVPGVNHLGTGRMQTVRKEWNPFYYNLLSEFGNSTGVPVLMNTSFNLRGEPIVNSPKDALNTFSKSGIDTLIMENFVVRKKTD